MKNPHTVQAAATLLLALALGSASADNPAQTRPRATASLKASAPEQPAVDLERAFWVCDHAASTRGVDRVTGIACGIVTENLKLMKFNGDFDAMLAWWRQRKIAEHQALEAAVAYADAGSAP